MSHYFWRTFISYRKKSKDNLQIEFLSISCPPLPPQPPSPPPPRSLLTPIFLRHKVLHHKPCTPPELAALAHWKQKPLIYNRTTYKYSQMSCTNNFCTKSLRPKTIMLHQANFTQKIITLHDFFTRNPLQLYTRSFYTTNLYNTSTCTQEAKPFTPEVFL